jgi:hypothetical protein
MKECTDETTLQAYFDGELEGLEMRRVAAHLAACPQCAAAAREVEDEMTALAQAFEAELSLPVPTESLRARIETALAAEQPVYAAPRRSWFDRVNAWLASLNAAQHQRLVFSAALSVVAAVSAGVVFFAMSQMQTPATPGSVAKLNGARVDISMPQPAPTSVAPTPKPASGQNFVAVKYVKPAPPAQVENKRPATPAPLPGEASYLRAIAALQREIGPEANLNSQPKLRAVYERNVAVLDNAIKASQRTARRNPQDTDAAGFLYSSYQSKLDLMSAVAAQTRPVLAAR